MEGGGGGEEEDEEGIGKRRGSEFGSPLADRVDGDGRVDRLAG